MSLYLVVAVILLFLVLRFLVRTGVIRLGFEWAQLILSLKLIRLGCWVAPAWMTLEVRSRSRTVQEDHRQKQYEALARQLADQPLDQADLIILRAQAQRLVDVDKEGQGIHAD